MTRRDSISTEIIRGQLRRDCEAAGHSPRDAARLSDRIISGYVFGGLAVALQDRKATKTNTQTHDEAGADRFGPPASGVEQVPAPLFDARGLPAKRVASHLRRGPNSDAPLFLNINRPMRPEWK